MVHVGDILHERYALEGRLGAGATSVVYRARDLRLGREVAVKVLLPNLAADPALAGRFDREARALAAVHHPAIVAIFDVTEGDLAAGLEPYYVMELGEASLGDRLAADERLDPETLVPIIAAIADGLAELHSRGMVHRDVKPSNILLTSTGARLADFGLTVDEASEDPGRTETEGIAGTPVYLAPERLGGGPASPAADVYALGAVAFRGLSGRGHRPAGSLAELYEHRDDPPPPVSSAVPELGTAFDEAVSAALAVGPATRPDAIALATALASSLGRWSRAGRPGLAGAVGATAVVSGVASPGRAIGEPALVPAERVGMSGPEDSVGIPGSAEPTTLSLSGPPERPSDAAIVDTDVDPSGSTVATARRRDPSALGFVGVAAIVLAAVFAVVMLGSIAPLGGAAGPSAPGSTDAGVSGPASSPGPSSASSVAPSLDPPTPSSGPPSDPRALIVASIDAVRQAVAAAQGGSDGLKGRDVRRLGSDLDDIGRAVADGRLDDAAERAERLADRVDELAGSKSLGEDRALPVQSAIAELRGAIAAAQDED